MSRRLLSIRCATSIAVATAALLSACGGGLYLSIGNGNGYDNFPPSISLATPATSVQSGQSIRVVAAAADENGIDNVAFYRLDGNNEVLLGSDGDSPYEWQVLAPSDGRNTLSVFARATDRTGNRADSAVLSVAVTR